MKKLQWLIEAITWEKLSQKEDKYLKFVDKNRIISVFDSNLNFIYVNKAMEKISWFTKKELLWKSIWIIREWDDVKTSKMYLKILKILKQGDIWSWEIVNKAKNWKLFWNMKEVTPIFNSNNEFIWFISIWIDTTQNHYIENEIVKEYKELTDKVSWIIILNADFSIKYVNKKMKSFFCDNKKDFIWMDYSEIIKPSLNPNFEDMYSTVKSWKLFNGDIFFQNKRGISHWFLNTFFPIYQKNAHQITWYISIMQDITEMKLAELTKTDFIKIASHELRTPLTVINWFLEMYLEWYINSPLLDKSLNSQQQELIEEFLTANINPFIKEIHTKSQNTIELINNIFDVAQFQSWDMNIKLETIDLKQAVYICLKDMFVLNKYKNHEISVSFSKKLEKKEHVYIEFDKIKLKQICRNLVSNAINFTDNNWKIEIKIKENNFSKNKITIIVKDNWIWINEENQKKLFQMFSHVWNVEHKVTTWTGLWLYIADKILNKLGWTIIVKSKENYWSEFIVNI